MPQKLKELEVTKVDFVDAGDNKGAHVVLFKRAVQKEAATFDEIQAEARKRNTSDEIWDFCNLLSESLSSIFWDDDIPAADKAGKMETSVEEFVTAVRAAIPSWTAGTPARVTKAASGISPERLAFLKQTYARLGGMLAGTETLNKQEGDGKTMRIDKSKLTPEELAALEAIEKKAGIPDEPPVSGGTASGTEGGQEPAPTQKSASAAPAGETGGGNAVNAEESLFKGLHPDVKKALDEQMARLSAQEERLKKQADAFEERELQEVAKRYALIGKTPEELVPLFKGLKAAGGDAYSQMIAVLDASVQAVEKSGLYSELGRSGAAGGGADAWSRIEKHADDIQKNAPNLTRAEAIDKACQQHPELVHEYEAGR